MAKIKDIPKVDRPREKFLKKGSEALSKSDLLAILLGSGIKGKNVQKLAQQIIKKFSKTFLNVTVEDLQTIDGIGPAKALQIVSAISLVKRFYADNQIDEIIIKNSQDVLSLTYDLRDKKKEYLICLYLNARNVLIKKEVISIGLVDKTLFHPREIFEPAFRFNASSIILIHNHPTGNVDPSEQDREIVNRISHAGKINGIEVLDFIIVAGNKHYSFYKELRRIGNENFDYVADGIQKTLFDLLEIEKPNYNANVEKKKNGIIKFIDLFAGIGGIKIGFENVGFQCVFSNDFDKNCKKVFDFNFLKSSGESKKMVFGDISQISTKQIPEFNILCGGFPCQPFSVAGNRQGFDDEKGRGNLFFDIIRILKEKKPEAFLLENVKNLKNHDNGNTIKVIYDELQKLGYKVTDKILNSTEYGNLPQNRERIYIVGFLDQNSFNNFKFPVKIPLTKTIHECLENQKVDDKYYYNGKPLFEKIKNYIVKKNTVYQWRRKYVRENKNKVCPTLTANMGMGGHNVPIILDKYGIRKLTPRECANFQGFPKSYRLLNITDSQLYKQFGNSVAIPVIERIAKNIKKVLWILYNYIMINYKLTIEDFKRVFEFGTSYYINPAKNTTGRTTGEPRGLGSILDAFTLGKLTEIGVEKILTENSQNKNYILDFDIKSTFHVKDEADIIQILENNKNREPNVFIEIKNTSENDRWIGLTEEQFNTIKRSAKDKKIYMIYASIHSKIINNNPKTIDLTGMFLKEIEDSNKSKIFQKFASLNAKCKIEFIISSDDLEKFSYPFERGMNMYETRLFDEKKRNSVYNQAGLLRKDALRIKKFRDFDSSIELKIKKDYYAEKKEISIFKVNGNFNLIFKKSKTIIECLSDVYVENNIFGKFTLKNDKFYGFNLATVGRDPKLKRNNLFIAKNKIYQLIEDKKITDPQIVLREIINNS